MASMCGLFTSELRHIWPYICNTVKWTGRFDKGLLSLYSRHCLESISSKAGQISDHFNIQSFSIESVFPTKWSHRQ